MTTSGAKTVSPGLHPPLRHEDHRDLRHSKPRMPALCVLRCVMS